MATMIFDLDGTLLDVRRKHYQVYSDAYRDLGQNPLSYDEYWARCLDGKGTFEIASELSEELFADFQRMWLERVESRKYLPFGSLFDGVTGMLTELAAEHRLLLLTLRRNRDLLMEEMRCRGLDEAFERVISPPGDAVREKAALVQDIDVGDDVWVIGDSEADVALAEALGARMVAVACGVRSAEYLARVGAACVVESVGDVVAVVAGVRVAS